MAETKPLTHPDPHAFPVVANVSGGKDSTALVLHLLELGIPHRRVFADTGWEHEDTYRYLDMLEERVGPIDRVSPLLPMADLIRKKGMFPGRLHRYCTSELKVRPINAYMAEIDPDWSAIVALGIRADESPSRALSKEWEHDGNDMERWTWRPLLNWTLDDVVDIHRRHNIAPNPLYLRGASRVGCWPCIHARKSELRLIADASPDRIAEIRSLEEELRERRAEKMKDPAYAAKATAQGFLDPTFFSQSPSPSTRPSHGPARRMADASLNCSTPSRTRGACAGDSATPTTHGQRLQLAARPRVPFHQSAAIILGRPARQREPASTASHRTERENRHAAPQYR